MRITRLLALGGLLLFVGSCREPDPWSEQGVKALLERTMPPGATLVSFSGLTQDESGTSAEWEVATGMTWNAYLLWLKDHWGRTSQLTRMRALRQSSGRSCQGMRSACEWRGFPLGLPYTCGSV